MAKVFLLVAMLMLTTTCSNGGAQKSKEAELDGDLTENKGITTEEVPIASDLSTELEASVLVSSTGATVTIEEDGEQKTLSSIPATAYFNGTYFIWLSESAQGVIATREGNVICTTQAGDLIDELTTNNNTLIATINNTAEIEIRDGSIVEVPRYSYNCISKERASVPTKNFLYSIYERDAETFGDKTFSIDFNTQEGYIEKILTGKGLNLLGADIIYDYSISADGSSLAYVVHTPTSTNSSIVQARDTETGVAQWKIEFVEDVDSIIRFKDKILVNLFSGNQQGISRVAVVNAATGTIEKTIATTSKVLYVS